MERERARRFDVTRRRGRVASQLIDRRRNPQQNLKFIESRRQAEDNVSEEKIIVLPNQLTLWSEIG